VICGAINDSARINLQYAKECPSISGQISFAKKALQYAIQTKDTVLIGDSYNFLGTAYQRIGNIEEGITYHLMAYDIFKMSKDKNGLSNSLNNLGIIHAKTGQFEEALNYFKEAMGIKQQLQNVSPESQEHLKYLSGSYNNIGLIHDYLAQFDSALYYFDQSLQIKKQLFDYPGIADSYSNIGITYLNMEEHGLAGKYLLKAYQVADSINDLGPFVNTTYNLAEFYFLAGDYPRAEKFINQCFEKVEIFGSRDLMMNVFYLLSKISFEKKDYKNGYLYLERFIGLKDSLINEETESRIAQLQIAHEVQRKDERIDLLEKEKQIEIQGNEFKSTLLLILYIFLFFTIVVAFVFFHQKKKLASANKELVKRNLELLSNDKNSANDRKISEIKYASSSLSDDKKQKILSEFYDLINKEKIFLKSDLTIDVAAEMLSISRTYLSQIVNETFDSNFTVYINKQRINYSMQLLSDTANDKYSIAGIAEMSGFNSISSFNTLFKQKTGLTPSTFRKAASNNL
jgi:AraC-like DNA-binding protein/Tfp pilus assembly protein PilF